MVAMEKGDIWVNTSGNWEFLSDIPFAGLAKGIHQDTATPREPSGIRYRSPKKKGPTA